MLGLYPADCSGKSVSGDGACNVRPMDDREWIARFAAALGVPAPTDSEYEVLLALAGTAAHASARTAAPVSCWVAGRAGVSLEEAKQVAETIVGG